MEKGGDTHFQEHVLHMVWVLFCIRLSFQGGLMIRIPAVRVGALVDVGFRV